MPFSPTDANILARILQTTARQWDLPNSILLTSRKLSMTLRHLLAIGLFTLASGPLLAATCEVEIDGTDAMQFTKTSIEVSKSCKQFTVKFKHAGKLPKAAMGHNWVLSKTADVQGIATDGIAAGLPNNYVKPQDARVIAHTKVLGPGESDAASFAPAKLAATESYTFFCSFPGHSAVMKGTLKLVN